MISSEEKIHKVIAKYGSSIQSILEKEAKCDIYELLGAVGTLVEAKISKALPTSPAERMIFALTWLGREVQNGGFHQYFFNSAGDFWDDALAGLTLIKDEDGLKHFEQTLSVFKDSSPSKERYTRQGELDELEEADEGKVWDHFGKMTNLFFVKPFPDWNLVYSYVKGHPDEFDFEGVK